MPLHLCPSDPSPALFMLHTPPDDPWALASADSVRPRGNPMFQVARANYSGVFGTNSIDTAPAHGDGCFFQNSRIRFGDIRDGLSNALLVGERSSRLDSATWVGAVPGAARGRARIVGRAGRVPNDALNDFSDFSSHHPFGANFLLADGSVRLISDQIDVEIYHALATRAGGEPIGAALAARGLNIHAQSSIPPIISKITLGNSQVLIYPRISVSCILPEF